MIETVAIAAEKAKLAAEAAETGTKALSDKISVDFSKRIDVSNKKIEQKLSGVNVAKRISPEGRLNIETGKGIELTPEQKKELLQRNMSEGIVKDCSFKDGVYKLKTLCENLDQKIQPESGVPYRKRIVDLNGVKVEGVFPKFDSVFTAQLPVDKLLAKDNVQFKECTNQLQYAIKENPSLKKQFTSRQLEQIANGKVPGGYVWHHNEEVGKMELVDRNKHDLAKHTGGKALWGGGSDYR